MRDAAQRLEYTPNAFARGLKLQRTSTLGLILANIGTAGTAQLVQSVERRAAHYGHVVLLADPHDFVRAGDVYRRLILERRVDGLILSSATADGGMIRDLTAQRVPFVILNRRSAKGAVCVSADDAAGVVLAAEHLIGLGHRRACFITGPRGEDAFTRGLEGYRAAMLDHGLSSRGTVAHAAVTEEGGFDATAGWLDSRRRPTALIAASVAQGVGAMAAVRAAGLASPADVSVVTVEDAPFAAYVDPPLTAVRMPLHELAELAVDQVISLVGGGEVRDVIVPTRPELVVRGSTAVPRETR